MGLIDSVKSRVSSLVSTVEEKVEAKVAQVETKAAEVINQAESFVETQKKPLSITGKMPAFQPSNLVPTGLKDSVASLRTLANSGMANASIGLGRDKAPDAAKPDGDALKKAISDKSDSGIRKLVNANPELLKQLSPQEKGQALEALRSGWTTGDDAAAMAKIVKSCETKGELRAVLAEASGKNPPGQAEMHKYDKQMTDTHPYLIADLLNPANQSLKEYHPDSITANEHVDDANKFPAKPGTDSVSLAGGDAAARRAFLEGMTQIDSSRKSRADGDWPSPAYNNGCGATCIVASALQNDDPKGAVSKLIDYNLAHVSGRYGENVKKELTDGLKELKGRMDKGEPLTRKDADLLQRATYNSLRELKDETGGNKMTDNINDKAITRFLDDSKIGRSGGVPTLVDIDQAPNNSGKTSTDHFVLVRSGRDSEIYDPWPRKDGQQIVQPGTPGHERYKEALDVGT